MKEKMNGIGGHTKPNKGNTVIWFTPKNIVKSLGIFDLDPCAAPAPRPWETAANYIELPDDGLKIPWFGRVWLNPPYDEHLGEWMQQMAMHKQGIALTFARTETDIWQRWIWPYAWGVLFISGRLYFHQPDGARGKGNAGGPSALIAYSEKDYKILENSGINGALVKVIRTAIL
jgi:hypothetical protein